MVLYFGLSDYLLVVYLVPGTTFVEKKKSSARVLHVWEGR